MKLCVYVLNLSCKSRY